MTAVAIVLILLAIAIRQVYDYQMSVKESEIAVNVNGIQVSLQAYHTAHDRIVAPISYNPPLPVAKDPVPWPTGSGFDTIGWAPDGDVRGRYSVVTPGTVIDPDPGNNCPAAPEGNACTIGITFPWHLSPPADPLCCLYGRWGDMGGIKVTDWKWYCFC
jgi:hypothetical protein